MAFIENLGDFINPDTPGYVVATIAGNAVDALFDNAYIETEFVAARNPIIHVKESDIAAVAVGAAVVVNAVNYKVAAPFESDGHGVALVQLSKA